MNRTVVYEILRWISAALVILLIVLHGLKNRVSRADPADVLSAVVSVVDTENMQEADAQMVKRLYGIRPAEYESCTLYYPKTNMGAEELLLVKLKDVSQRDAVLEAVEKRIDTQKNAFDGYAPAQFALLENHAVVEPRGNYVLFVVSAEADAAKTAFTKAL